MNIKLGDIKNKEQLSKIKEYCDSCECNKCKNYCVCKTLNHFPYNEYNFNVFSQDVISIPQLQEVLVWINDEKIELTEDEKHFLSLLKDKFQYIARDEDGSIFVYSGCKPHKATVSWINDGNYERIDKLVDYKFECISFEDDEPFNFREYLKGGE